MKLPPPKPRETRLQLQGMVTVWGMINFSEKRNYKLTKTVVRHSIYLSAGLSPPSGICCCCCELIICDDQRGLLRSEKGLSVPQNSFVCLVLVFVCLVGFGWGGVVFWFLGGLEYLSFEEKW